MRLGIVALLVVPLLAACGDEKEAGGPQQTPTEQPAAQVLLVHATAAGEGDGAAALRPVDTTATLDAFAAQFLSGLDQLIKDAAATVTVPDGKVLAAAVAAVGCDVPTSAVVHGGGLHPEFTGKRLPECFAPVTTVGLVAVDPDALPEG